MRILALCTAILVGTPIAAQADTPDPHVPHSSFVYPGRETTLLRALPLRAQLKAERKAVWVRRVKARREARRNAAAAVASTSSPTPSYDYPSGPLSAEQVASYARGAGFPEWVIPEMVAIAARESGFNPGAINSSSGACGLWQLYPCPGSEYLNPATNAAGAYAKYAASGLSPWAATR